MESIVLNLWKGQIEGKLAQTPLKFNKFKFKFKEISKVKLKICNTLE